jgi:hypothetical protein
MWIIYLHNKFCMSTFNGLLVIAIKPKDKIFPLQPRCYFIFYKKYNLKLLIFWWYINVQAGHGSRAV